MTPRAALLLVCLTGCAGSAQLLERVRVAPRTATAGGPGIILDVDLTNPNPEPVTLVAVDWSLVDDKGALARGRYQLFETVPPGVRHFLRIELPGRVPPYPRGEARVEGLLHFTGKQGERTITTASSFAQRIGAP